MKTFNKSKNIIHSHTKKISQGLTKIHLLNNNTQIPNNSKLLNMSKNNFKKVAIISQTTMSVNGYNNLIQNINKNFNLFKFLIYIEFFNIKMDN